MCAIGRDTDLPDIPACSTCSNHLSHRFQRTVHAVPGSAGALEPDQTVSVHSRAGICLIVARALEVLWQVAQGAAQPP